jgi:hypothetical protein
MDLGRAQIAYDNKEPIDSGNFDKYVEENLLTHAEQVKLDCLNDHENEVFDVAATLDPDHVRALIQAVCMGIDAQGIAAIATGMVAEAVKMVAEEQLIIKFEKGEA